MLQKTNMGDNKAARKTQRTWKTRNAFDFPRARHAQIQCHHIVEVDLFQKGGSARRSSTEFDGRFDDDVSTELEVVSKATPAGRLVGRGRPAV